MTAKREESETASSDEHLQFSKLGGSTQKTLWQCCQLVVVEIPGQWETKQACEPVVLTSDKSPANNVQGDIYWGDILPHAGHWALGGWYWYQLTSTVFSRWNAAATIYFIKRFIAATIQGRPLIKVGLNRSNGKRPDEVTVVPWASPVWDRMQSWWLSILRPREEIGWALSQAPDFCRSSQQASSGSGIRDRF